MKCIIVELTKKIRKNTEVTNFADYKTFFF